MSEREPRRGRPHDAEGAREAILNAAEEIFAEHGFDGARIAAIAQASGYNSSLIFQYFDDKSGLYAAILKRADRELSELQAQVLDPLFKNETAFFDAHTFRALLTTIVQAVFDYLLEHPRLMRILLWEMAEGWHNYKKLMSQLRQEDLELFKKIFQQVHEAGLLRSDFVPTIQLTLVVQVCQSYLGYLPLYQAMLSGEDLSSPDALARAREYVVTFVVAGIMVDPKVDNDESSRTFREKDKCM